MKQTSVQLVKNWSQSDPRAAATWVQTLPSAELRSDVYPALLASWAQYDRDTAVGYLDRIPRGVERDAALVGLVQATRDEVSLAESLFARISGDSQRRAAARQLYYALRMDDPVRAERYRIAAGIDASHASTADD